MSLANHQSTRIHSCVQASKSTEFVTLAHDRGAAALQHTVNLDAQVDITTIKKITRGHWSIQNTNSYILNKTIYDP